MNPYEPHTDTTSLSLLYNTSEARKSYNNSFALKRKYISHLQPVQCGKSEFIGFEEKLFERPVEILQALYLSLRNVFTDKCSNAERSTIINCLLNVDQSQWDVLLKQVCFIMPIGTRGHDVMWATEILSSVVDSAYREQLTNVANRLFKYDTLTVERGYILDSLAKLDSEKLSNIDNADEQTRVQFVTEHVPKSLKEGAKVAFVYDPIQEKGWKV